jgi:hypothetical protein
MQWQTCAGWSVEQRLVRRALADNMAYKQEYIHTVFMVYVKAFSSVFRRQRIFASVREYVQDTGPPVTP